MPDVNSGLKAEKLDWLRKAVAVLKAKEYAKTLVGTMHIDAYKLMHG